jgi:hypothetical protein
MMPELRADATVTEWDRQRAIVALRDRYASDHITIEKFCADLDRVFAATTRDELTTVAPPLPQMENASGVVGDVLAGAHGALRRHLQQGEELLWVGQPDPSKHFSSMDRILIPFSILWAGFAILWETVNIAAGAPAFFAVFGAAFVAAGLYFTFGRFIYKAHRKRRTIYAVTNRRVLSVVGTRSDESVESMYLRSIPSVSVNARADGSGNVMLTSTPWMYSMYLNSGMDFAVRSLGGGGVNFFDIPGARAVGHLVDSLVASLGG